MKIALLSPSIYMSPTRYADMIFAPRDLSVALADGLVDRGHEVYFFTSHDTKTRAHLVAGDAQLLNQDYVKAMLEGKESERLRWGYFSTLKREYEMDLTERCYAQAKEKGFDVVHSYHEKLAHFFNDLTGVPTVYTLHDPLPQKEIDLTYWLLRKFAHHNYVSISDSFRRHDSLHLNFLQTVYHGLRAQMYQYSPDPGAYALFMGRLIVEKGLEDALQASSASGIPLHVATSKMEVSLNDSEYYAQKVAPLVDETRVSFVGFMEDRAKLELLGKARCLLFPIHWEEPFGMVMIEAMACGTPVVAYNRGSVAEVIVDGKTGFIIDPDNEDRPGKGTWTIKKQGVEGLVEAIKRIGEIDRAACRRHVEEHFTVEKMVEGYERVYQRVLEKG